jgi:hypothetical protein
MADKKEQTPEEIIAAKDQQIARNEERISTLESKVEKLLELPGSVIAAPEEKKKARIPTEPVIVDKKKYMFKFPAFWFETVRYESQDAALDIKLLGKIIALEGQGILKEIF